MLDMIHEQFEQDEKQHWSEVKWLASSRHVAKLAR